MKIFENISKIMRISLVIGVLFIASVPNMQAQFFENEHVIISQKVPVLAYLYKYPAAIVQTSAQDIWGDYQIDVVQQSDSSTHYRFSGSFINSTLLEQIDIIYSIEAVGEDKSIIYLSAVNPDTDHYASAIRNTTVINDLKQYFETIELHCMDVVRRQYLSDQYQKIFELKNEIQALTDELGRVEDETPNATTQITRLRHTIRLKKMKLDEENQILENLLQMN